MGLVVLNEEQLACLASPACGTVFRALRALGRGTANELAVKVERSAATVIYHLRRLEEVGLVEIVERRPAVRKPESVYQPTDTRFRLPEDERTRELRIRTVQAGLRYSMRGWERAARTGAKGMHVIQAQLRLRPEDAEQFLRLIEEASKFAIENENPQGDLISWSSLVFPNP